MIGKLEELINSYGCDKKCGFNWHFIMSNGESNLNRIQIRDDDCCSIYFVVEEIRPECVKAKNKTGLIQSTGRVRYELDLFIGIPNSMGDTFYNEKSDVDKSNSKWVNIHKQIIDCLLCFDDCAGFEVEKWEFTGIKQNHSSNVFDGWNVKGVFVDG